MKTKLFCVGLLFTLTAFAYGQRCETFAFNGEITNTVEIGELETVRVSSLVWASRRVENSHGSVLVVKDGYPWRLDDSNELEYTKFPGQFIVRGPATVIVSDTFSTQFGRRRQASEGGFVTIEIAPEAMPPGKAVTVGPRTSALIEMEISTNLMDWTGSVNGAYTAEESPKFFRLKAQRID